RGDRIRGEAPPLPARPAGGQGRMEDVAAHRERLLRSDRQQHQFSRRHSPAAVLRFFARRRGQLRRNRRGHRPRDHARLRRPGPPLRRRRQPRGVVDARGCRAVPGAREETRGAVLRLRAAARSESERRADSRREHRRSRRREPRLRSAGALARRQGEEAHRRAHARAALLPLVGAGVAHQHARECPAPATRRRSPLAGDDPRNRPAREPPALLRRLRHQGRRSDVAQARGPRQDLVTKIFLVVAFVGASCPAFAAETPLASLPYTPGLDVNAMDKSADPCVDFYRFACGGWMKNNPIPPDESRGSVYGNLHQDNQRFLWGILDALAKRTAARSAAQQKIGDYFAACVDEAAVEKSGARSLKRRLDRIAGMKSKRDLPAVLARLHLVTGGSGFFFGFSSNPDFADSTSVIAFADSGGLG